MANLQDGPKRWLLDIGAADGVYTFWLTPICFGDRESLCHEHLLQNRYTPRLPPAIRLRVGRVASAVIFSMAAALPFSAAFAQKAVLWANEISAQHAIVDVPTLASTLSSSNGRVTLSENEDRAAQAIRSTPRPLATNAGSTQMTDDRTHVALARSTARLSDTATIDNGVRNAQRAVRDDDRAGRASPTIAPIVTTTNQCHLEVAYAPVLIRLGANEFRVAFGVSREGCDAGCSGYINYDAVWTDEDQSVGRASRSVGFTFPRDAKGTIALDRQIFHSGDAAHATNIVDVIPREVGCTSVVVSR